MDTGITHVLQRAAARGEVPTGGERHSSGHRCECTHMPRAALRARHGMAGQVGQAGRTHLSVYSRAVILLPCMEQRRKEAQAGRHHTHLGVQQACNSWRQHTLWQALRR